MKRSVIRVFTALTVCLSIPGAPAQDVREPEAFRIKNEDVELQGYFHTATGKGPFPTIILLQGWAGGGMDSLQLGANLAASGINSFTFHYRGTYLSGGVFTFENLFKDLDFILNLLRSEKFKKDYQVDASKIILGGHNFGGAVSLTYAANNPQVRSVFAVGAPDHSQVVRQYLQDPQTAERLDASFAKMEAPEGPVRGGVAALRDMVEHPDMHDLVKLAPKFKGRKILLVGGWEDTSATVDDHIFPYYRALKKAGIKDLKFIVCHTDHSFSSVRPQLAGEILKWISEVYKLPQKSKK